MRLDKYIANCGYASRKEVKKLIRRGSVTVDGIAASSADADVSEDAEICVDGTRLIYREFVYLMLNKPAGYVSATEDKKYPVVTDLIGSEYAHFKVFPVGRLDIDTEGLLLLSNDGAFAHEMTSPKKNIYKKYFAVLDRPAEQADIAVFAEGMNLGDFTAKPAILEITKNPNEVYISIAEGKFHQVKRMCQKTGKTVTYLKRVSVGPLELDTTLPPGESRELTNAELSALRDCKKV